MPGAGGEAPASLGGWAVSTVLDRLGAIRDGRTVLAACPRCNRVQQWWCVGAGVFCGGEDCGYVIGHNLDLPDAPPVILCSGCGEPLQQGDGGFSCGPCARTITP